MQAACRPWAKSSSTSFYSAHSLYALNNAGADIALGKLCFPRLKVVDGQVSYVAVGVDGRYYLRIVGRLDGQRRASVESLGSRQHARTSRLERRKLQCVLVSLGSAVDQEQLVVVIPASLAQPFGQPALQSIYHRVAVKAEGVQLFGHLLNVVGMAMTYANDGVAAVKV